jgi:hypoxanthine phosphoribosyltransferase
MEYQSEVAPTDMKIKDLEFKKLISADKINKKIKELSEKINEEYKGKSPLFIPILNGSFMFASDLLKEIDVSCRISFVKIASYSGTSSTGQVNTLIGLEESLFNQDVIIVEDIADSGLTLQRITEELRGRGAKSVEVICLLRKTSAREKNIDIKHVGFDLDDEFVVGYGLDYDGFGRNLKDIYKQISQ